MIAFIIGACFGVMIAGMMAAAKHSDECMLAEEIELMKRERDAAVKDCACFPCWTCAELENGDNCNWCTSVDGFRTGYVWRGAKEE